MMRSLFSGVAGLKTHQTKMDVIGNNISNVNTVAYKASSIVFADLMSQTTQKASGPNDTVGTGGLNARQIGLGVKSGAININITGQGSAQSTGNPFDIMIEGENFFVVNNGVQNLFTRDGSFYVDAAGNLAMTSTGYNVMGWQFDEETNAIRRDTVSALRIMSAANMTYPPEATTRANMSGIIDKFDPEVSSANGRSVNLNFFDAQGYLYTAKFVFRQTGDLHKYSVELEKIENSIGEEIDLTPRDPNATNFQILGTSNQISLTGGYSWNGTVLRDNNGNDVAWLDDIVSGNDLRPRKEKPDPNHGTVQEQLNAIAQAYGCGGADDFLNMVHTYEDTSTNPPTQATITVKEMLVNSATSTLANETLIGTTDLQASGVTVDFDPSKGFFTGINGVANQNTVTLNLSGIGEGNFENIVIDFAQVSVVDNKGTCTIGATSGDYDNLGMGRRLGKMIGVAVEKNGRITASYDSGVTRCLGQIATASFANAAGLEKMGDNMYAATLNSGEFDGIGVDITASGGKMSTGQLEMSNVDLSSEFTEMITTQRGFQANSRIITVSDSLLEELTNLKR